LDKNLTKRVCDLYGMSRTDFANYSKIPYKTLEGWETKGCSALGKILLEKFIELKEIELKHQEELSEYKDKAERFDTIQRALSFKG